MTPKSYALVAAIILSGATLVSAASESGSAQDEPDQGKGPVERKVAESGTTPITFHCCDDTGESRCDVVAPGPAGEPCFCPGLIPAGKLCLQGRPPE